MDLETATALFKDQKVLNDGKGHGGDNGDVDGKSPYDEVVEKSAKLREADKGLTLGESYSQVLGADKDLNKRYNASLETVDLDEDGGGKKE